MRAVLGFGRILIAVMALALLDKNSNAILIIGVCVVLLYSTILILKWRE